MGTQTVLAPTDYPYEAPADSQVVLEGTTLPIATYSPTSIAESTVRGDGNREPGLKEHAGGQLDEVVKAARWPVVAYGSNANPKVLSTSSRPTSAHSSYRC